jgi:hypothetical protein
MRIKARPTGKGDTAHAEHFHPCRLPVRVPVAVHQRLLSWHHGQAVHFCAQQQHAASDQCPLTLPGSSCLCARHTYHLHVALVKFKDRLHESLDKLSAQCTQCKQHRITVAWRGCTLWDVGGLWRGGIPPVCSCCIAGWQLPARALAACFAATALKESFSSCLPWPPACKPRSCVRV